MPRPALARYPADFSVAQLEADLCAASFRDFIPAAWHVIEPGTRFDHNWHVDVIADHLQAVIERRIKRLIINIPPRHGKSDQTSVMLPAWAWAGASPHHRFLCGSYALALANRDQLATRKLCDSAWYRQRWPQVNVRGNTDLVSTMLGGERRTTAVDAGATGFGGETILIDDPHNVQQAESAATRIHTIKWVREVMSTRLNDPANDAIVIIMQRSHAEDVTGELAKDGNWELLMLPTEFESARRCVTSLGIADKRQAEGELLWPKRFTPKVVADTKILLGSYGWAGQHQQRPSPKGGGTIQLAWFKRFHVEPARYQRCTISVDTANKSTAGSAYTAAGVFLETENGDYLAEVWRERVEFGELVRKVIALNDKYMPSAIVIEDKASGIQLLQTLHAGIDGRRFPVIGIEPEGDKEMRLSVESPYIEAGNVWLPAAAPWLWDFEQEAESFPNSAFADQMDMLSQFLTYRRTRGGQLIRTARVVGY